MCLKLCAVSSSSWNHGAKIQKVLERHKTFAKFFFEIGCGSKVSSVKSVIKVFWLEKRALNNILFKLKTKTSDMLNDTFD